MIHLLFTGGTISMQRDPAAGGNVPAHAGEKLVELGSRICSGSHRIASRTGPRYQRATWARTSCGPSASGSGTSWESGEVTGIVITHGTDTIEETGYLLDRTVDPSIPIVITGAMRTSSDAGWDGPRNLIDAAAVAASARERGTWDAWWRSTARCSRGETAVKIARHRYRTPLPRRTRGRSGTVEGRSRARTSPDALPVEASASPRGSSARVALVRDGCG